MKISGSPISGPQRVGAGASAPKKGGFAVASGSGAKETAASARAGGAAGVASLDALLALQELDGPLERRKRSVKRAGRILDELDGMKLALLGDEAAAPGALLKLQKTVGEERSRTDDPGLEGVLDQIEVRAAVELAKREPRAPVAGLR